jgi:chromate transporter
MPRWTNYRKNPTQRRSFPRIAAVQKCLLFLRLGCMSFGGPIAQLGYFDDEFVVRRR